jgi:hypothetical protein
MYYNYQFYSYSINLIGYEIIHLSILNMQKILRIVDGIIDIGALENQNPIVCFRYDSLIKVGIDKYIRCDKLFKGDNVLSVSVSVSVDKNYESQADNT